MPEQPILTETEKIPHPVSVPDRIAVSYAKALGELMTPHLNALREQFTALKSAEQGEKGEDKNSFTSEMEGAVVRIEDLLKEMGEKKTALAPINGGWDLSFGEQRTTPVKLPHSIEYVHPALASKFRSALQHRINNATALLGYAELYGDSFALHTDSIQRERDALADTINPLLSAKNVAISVDKDGQVRLMPLDNNKKIPDQHLLKTPPKT